MYRELTRDILIEVEPAYVAEESRPHEQYYFFSYTIRIQNTGTETVQLLNRHWTIVDGKGHTREVHGPGVVGEQPMLRPGETFEYTSFCPLPTPTGNMRGRYNFAVSLDGKVSEDSEHFDAKIPLFFLRDLTHQVSPTPTLH